jgi:hypothetical protein
MINMATAGSGTPHHIAGELFKMMGQVYLLSVPDRGEVFGAHQHAERASTGYVCHVELVDPIHQSRTTCPAGGDVHTAVRSICSL